MDFIWHVLVAAVVFVAIDSVWLGGIANKLYKKELKHLLADKPNFIPAGFFYVLYMIGMVVFAIDPALEQDSLSFVIGHGALLGLVMYATYDLTNHATVKNWPAKITYIDLVWGTFITTLTSAIVFLIFR